MSPSTSPPVHVVIPCFDEASRLDTSAFTRFLEVHPEVALTLVNDGSRDQTLARLEEIESSRPSRVVVIDLQPNQGKAEAVRTGVLSAIDRGARFVGYWDADLATPLEVITEARQILEHNEDIDFVLGARVALLGHHIDRKWYRHYLGRVFATAASMTLGLPVYDTQCGAKLLRVDAETRALFEQPFGSRWIFDVELIARYLRGRDAHGLYEMPLKQWTDVGESKVRPIHFVRAFGEMAQIYRKYSMLRNFQRFAALLLSPAARYAMVGAIGTLAHYVALTGLVEIGDMRASLATTLGAVVGATVNYILNYHFTFASQRAHARTFPRFITVAVLGMLVSGLGLWLGSDVLGLYYLGVQVACTVAVLVIGYALNRAWTFGPPPDEDASPSTVADR